MGQFPSNNTVCSGPRLVRVIPLTYITTVIIRLEVRSSLESLANVGVELYVECTENPLMHSRLHCRHKPWKHFKTQAVISSRFKWGWLPSSKVIPFISWWTVTAYVYNTVYSEITACNLTLTPWLQHSYKQSRLCVTEQWPPQPHACSQVDYIACSGVCCWHHEIKKLQHGLQCIMLVTLA